MPLALDTGDPRRATARSPLALFQGMPRCGSSWLVQVLAAPLLCRIANEPFNPLLWPRAAGVDVGWRPPGDADPVVLRRFRGAAFPPARRILVKDVQAFLQVEAIWAEFDFPTVFVVRHPCAMAASWRRIGFVLDVVWPLVAESDAFAEAFLGPRRAHVLSEDDWLFRFGACWGAVYGYLLEASRRAGRGVWVRHEDLCARPEEEFAGIARRVGIPFGMRSRRRLRGFDGDSPVPWNPFVTARRTADEPDKWRSELAEAESAAVLRGASAFEALDAFYPAPRDAAPAKGD